MSRQPSIRRWVTGALVAVALLAGGCGSGAVEGPDEDDAASDQADEAGGGSGGDDSGDGGGGDTDRDRFTWNLPVGDVTPDSAFIIYQALRDGGCDAGEEAVTIHGSILTDEQRRLYDAAIAVCRGDIESGRTLFAGAGYGDSRSACFVHAAVLSVLDQQPPDTSGCPPNPGEGTASTTEPDESSSTTEGETTTSAGEGETATMKVDGVGDGEG